MTQSFVIDAGTPLNATSVAAAALRSTRPNLGAMDTLGAGPIVTVSYTSTPGMERRASWAGNPVRWVLPWVTLVTLAASAVLRGTTDLLVFGAAIAVGGSVALLRWQRAQRGGLSQLATITFTRTGVSVHGADRQQSFPWSLVRSVGHRSGFWVFRLPRGEAYVVLPESALDDDQAAALTELLRGKGLLRS